MRPACFLPALLSGLAFTAGQAQDIQPLPPSVLSSPALRSAPAPGAASEGGNSVTSVSTAGKITSSTSASKQFTVYGSDLQTRGSFCQLCEDTAAALGRLLKDSGRFSVPIVVVLKPASPAAVPTQIITTSFSQLAYGGFHLQISVELRDDFSKEEFAHELVRMLLAERILRDHKEVQTTRSQLLSGWLLTGVSQAMEFRSRSRPSALFAAVFRSGQVFSIDRIIEANPADLDALARGIYETSSCALVLTLLDQPDGSLRFSKFLSGLANGNKGDRDLLQEHFPTLGVSKNSLEKWWTLQMASLATLSTFESMSIDDTEAALDRALTFRLADSSGSTAPVVEEEAAPKKPGGIRGWFRRDSKDGDEQPSETKGSDGDKKDKKTTSAAVGAALNVSPLFSPLSWTSLDGLFVAGRMIAAPVKPGPSNVDGAAKKGGETKKTVEADPEEEKKSRGFMGLFGRGKGKGSDESAPGEPDKAPGAKPPVSKKAEASPSPAPEPEKKKGTPREPEPVIPPPALRPAPAPAETVTVNRISIEEYPRLSRRNDRTEILKRAHDQLNNLKMRGHPLYRPVVSEYADVVQQLMLKKFDGLPARLETLKKARVEVREQAKAVDSLVDWYEADQTESYSHVFDDYLKLRDHLEKEAPKRTDAISRYLDSLQKEFEE